jgi:hypothetical protein
MIAIYSSRGIMLIVTSDARPLVTVEYSSKWYNLFLIDNDRVINEPGFDLLEKFALFHTPAYIDHVPNPTAVERFAESIGAEVDPMALEIMWGRWMLEGIDR